MIKIQANQREEEYKNQIKTLTTRLKEVCHQKKKIMIACCFVRADFCDDEMFITCVRV